MPRANPERSFDASARHLFRHMDDEGALRHNPLLRSYFRIENGESRGILAAIRADILALTGAICDELGSKGLQLQARRRREIIVALCTGKTAAETAAELRISRSHYYRERQVICSRIARALVEAATTRDARSVVRDDALRLLLRRAESLRDGGSSNEAVRALEDGYACIVDELAKSAVGLALAEELVFLGARERATELFARSQSPPPPNGNGISEWLGDVWALNKARIESQLSRDAAAASALERLARRRIAERRSDDVTFDAVFLCGESYRNAGKYDEARKMLRHLRAMEQSSVHALAKRHIAIALLAGYCAESSTDEFGLAEQSLRDALDLSIASGTIVGALLATSGLIRQAASRGHDDAVYAMAHEALHMARGADFGGFLGFVVAEIVDALLETRYWRAAAPLVFEAEQIVAPGTARQALLKHAQARYLMKAARRDKAREAMLEAYTIAKKLGNRRLEGIILRDRASMLSGQKELAQRADRMREAVALVERFGSASDMAATYAAAARVLGDRRIHRLARQTGSSPPFGAESDGKRQGRYSLRVEPLRLPNVSAC
jgi:tetratricopeptide (TPR) repeat protein